MNKATIKRYASSALLKCKKAKHILCMLRGIKNWFYNYVEFALQQYDTEKCERILEGANIVISALWGIIGAAGVISSHWLLIVIAVCLGGIHIALWFTFHHVLDKRSKVHQDQMGQLKTNYESLCVEHQNLILKHKHLSVRLREIVLLSKHIATAQKEKQPKALYTCLANSISQMVTEYSDLTTDQFSVSIYMYDGNSGLLQRVEVSTTVSTIQTPRTNRAEPIERKSKYFYAKSIQSTSRTHVINNSAEFEAKFYFEGKEKELLKHYSQYAAMNYSLGSRMKMYVEVISYDNAKLGDDLEELISNSIAPFASQIALIDWYRMRGDMA